MPPSIFQNELVIGKNYTKEILDAIQKSTSSLYVLMFVWRWRVRDPSSDIALINQAVLHAVKRGVTVRVFCNFKGMAEHLNTIGIQAKSWDKAKLMHAKCILVDERTLFIGSHNLTEPAMAFNVEVSAKLHDTLCCVQFKNYFNSLWQS